MVLESSGVSRRLRSEVQVSSEEVAHKFFITAKNEEFIEISSDVRLAKVPFILRKISQLETFYANQTWSLLTCFQRVPINS